MTEQKRSPAPGQRPQTKQQEAMSKMMRTQMIYMMISLVSMFVIFNGNMRVYIGVGMSYILMPLLGFNYQYPILTIVLMGILIGLITSIPRYFFTDWMKMGRIQNRMRAFNKVFNEAMRSNQRDKMQKLQKMRMEMSMEQSQVSMNTMKPLMVFTVFTILLIAWLYYFLGKLDYQVIAFPWDYEINVVTSHIWLIPYWISVYFITIMLFSYLVTMFIKYFDFTYKVRKIERQLGNENYN